MATKETTPMMEQYQKIKDQYPDAFLFYRLGDFYELFNDDAIKGSQILELTLTNRNRKSENPIPMCGVPHKAAKSYIDTLVDLGYKVALCEQVEDPKTAKGMVKREVVQLITPGTKFDSGLQEAKNNNYLVAINRINDQFNLAYVDLSTGELKVTSLNSENDLLNEVINLQSKEVVVQTDFSEAILNSFSKLNILISKQAEIVNTSLVNYLTQSEELTGEQKSVLKLLLSYVSTTQKRSLEHIKAAVSYKISDFLEIDYNSQANLELTKNIRTQKKSGSLLWLLDQTKTAMGGRKLKQWIERPLVNSKKIDERQKLIQIFLDNYFERKQLQDELVKVYDLERLIGRISFGSVNGRDLIQLKNSLNQVPKIKYILDSLNNSTVNKLIQDFVPIDDVVELIEKSINEDAPISVTDGNIIKPNYNQRLDEYRDATANGQKWLVELEQKERQLTGINNLKIKYNKVFGYYIEVTKSNLDKVPEDRYQRKQTLTNAERFSTDELANKESLILEAQEKSKDLEYQLFVEIRESIKKSIKRIQLIADIVAKIDVLQSLTEISEEYKFIYPQRSIDHDVEIIDGRHPVVEKVLGHQKYVPNSIVMDNDTNILLITGPNMSGKSTYMRQFALIVILNQIGCFVPAKSAKLPIFDKIFTRIGAADDLISGESTFMVEMKEANNALKNATKDSLILFDEIGRGTATYDGMALAQSIIEYDHDQIQAKTLFSTHYHELTELSNNLVNLKNVHVGATEDNGELIFLHNVTNGPADKSYGIHVAKLAGLPDALLTRADKILQNLESDDKKVKPSIPESSEQMELLEDPVISKPNSTILDELSNLDLMSKTPMQIMNQVYKWQQKLK